MKILCTLDPALHNCPCLVDRNDMICSSATYCCFRDVIPDVPAVPVKPEKWFEKYYKDSRRIQ